MQITAVACECSCIVSAAPEVHIGPSFNKYLVSSAGYMKDDYALDRF
jgi:hypothetical protein